MSRHGPEGGDGRSRLVGGSRRAVALRFIPARVRAAHRLRPGPAVVLAPVRQRGPRHRSAGGAGTAADRGDRGARGRLDPAARPARRGVRPGVRRRAAGLPVEPAYPGRRGGA